jgi:DNA-binding GntR family transcriptional regulator
MTTAKSVGATTRSLADRAYREIRAMILDLRLLPGQTILIDELSAQLGMSRTPVREAVTRLTTSMEGLVATVPRKGIVVTVPTVEGMREIYEIIQALEGQAVKLAIARVDEETLAALEESVVAQEAALVADNLNDWTQSDRRFHHLLVDAAGNRCLGELVRLFDGQLHRTRVATARLRPNLAESTRDHRGILDALRARDAARAVAVHTAHRERALHELLQVVADYSGLVLRAAVQNADGEAVGATPGEWS